MNPGDHVTVRRAWGEEAARVVATDPSYVTVEVDEGPCEACDGTGREKRLLRISRKWIYDSRTGGRGDGEVAKGGGAS